MNKILIAARKARGAAEAEVAALLGIATPAYLALECGKDLLTPAAARTLGAFFAVPAWYFLEASRPLDIDARIRLLQAQLGIISKPEYRAVPQGDPVALAATTIELMIAKEELGKSLLRELELAEELAALALLYEDREQGTTG